MYKNIWVWILSFLGVVNIGFVLFLRWKRTAYVNNLLKVQTQAQAGTTSEFELERKGDLFMPQKNPFIYRGLPAGVVPTVTVEPTPSESPTPTPQPTQPSEENTPTPTPTQEPTPTPSASPTPTPTPTSTPTPTVTPTPTPTESPTPTPTPSPTPAPTGSSSNSGGDTTTGDSGA